MTKEQLQNFKWQPPPEIPSVVTPRDIYVVKACLEYDEDEVWERIDKLCKDYDIVDFRPPLTTDSFISYGTFPIIHDKEEYTDNIPRFIVKKKRVFTDTERLEYMMVLSRSWNKWGKSREEIDKTLRDRLEHGLSIT